MSGDPCICGDTKTWHPKCYRKRRKGDGMKYTDDQLGKIYGDMPDAGLFDDMRYFIELGRADGRREGMEEAARMVDAECARILSKQTGGKGTAAQVDSNLRMIACVLPELSASILAAIPTTETAPPPEVTRYD